MVTEVDVCNMALVFLGDRGSISSLTPPEGSAQANHCARLYPLALARMLECYPWSFALKRARVSALRDHPNTYALPSDCRTLVSLLGMDGRVLSGYCIRNVEGRPAVECGSLLHDVSYVSSEVPAFLFPAHFAEALAHMLASKLAGSIVGGSSGVELSMAQLKLAEEATERAIRLDAQQNGVVHRDRLEFMGDFTGGAAHA